MAHLTQAQRYTIEVMYQKKHTQTYIAETICKDKSVVSRELRRNCDRRNGCYKSNLAQRKYDERMQHKPKKIYFTGAVKEYVNEKLNDDYSPEQIAGRAKLEGKPCVSHERIYQYVWEDKKKGGKWYKHLRHRGRKYRKRGSSKDKRGIIKDRIGIEERPKIVDDKVRFGDVEIDTIIGANHQGAILTLNERVTSLCWIAKLTGKDALELAQKTVDLLKEWRELIHTITSDNGKEFAKHELISSELEIDFYFARPYRSCERGANENMNGLIRQYIPKKSSFENIDNEYINYIQHKLNNRPRKKLGYLSPSEYYYANFAPLLTGQKVAFVA